MAIHYTFSPNGIPIRRRIESDISQQYETLTTMRRSGRDPRVVTNTSRTTIMSQEDMMQALVDVAPREVQTMLQAKASTLLRDAQKYDMRKANGPPAGTSAVSASDPYATLTNRPEKALFHINRAKKLYNWQKSKLNNAREKLVLAEAKYEQVNQRVQAPTTRSARAQRRQQPMDTNELTDLRNSLRRIIDATRKQIDIILAGIYNIDSSNPLQHRDGKYSVAYHMFMAHKLLRTYEMMPLAPLQLNTDGHVVFNSLRRAEDRVYQTIMGTIRRTPNRLGLDAFSRAILEHSDAQDYNFYPSQGHESVRTLQTWSSSSTRLPHRDNVATNQRLYGNVSSTLAGGPTTVYAFFNFVNETPPKRTGTSMLGRGSTFDDTDIPAVVHRPTRSVIRDTLGVATVADTPPFGLSMLNIHQNYVSPWTPLQTSQQSTFDARHDSWFDLDATDPLRTTLGITRIPESALYNPQDFDGPLVITPGDTYPVGTNPFANANVSRYALSIGTPERLDDGSYAPPFYPGGIAVAYTQAQEDRIKIASVSASLQSEFNDFVTDIPSSWAQQPPSAAILNAVFRRVPSNPRAFFATIVAQGESVEQSDTIGIPPAPPYAYSEPIRETGVLLRNELSAFDVPDPDTQPFWDVRIALDIMAQKFKL